ncbi:M20/M25/M40 family metallo-hydrolase [Granulicella sp. 5B5]|uniref:M20/M25/M40 family metallo-hydrolase n=1 Tax=Granulicella sp. 5B5 TaxID=1617967 RepID=UPI0015F4C489|nr:M20/M25/M40 family metallo-hydrolase [Granulicella sp. 5B5]QMV19540.1 M20/M25/M40 family metallo-hydrolase [Granulicella sp. 5B5]
MKNWLMAAAIVAGFGVSGNAWAQAKPDPVESAMVKDIDASTARDVALLEKIVDINSGTMNLPGVVKVKDVIEPRLVGLGFTTHWNSMEPLDGRAGDLVAEHPCAMGAGKCGKRILLIGHMDTVFEPTSTFQKYEIVPGTNGRVATGPGAADMKGGLVIMLSALRAMKVVGVLDKSEITIVLSGDEENHGRPTSVSRKDMIDAAKHSDLALEFENASRDAGSGGTGVDGQDAVRIGRRSSTSWRLETTGRTGHSSQVFGEEMGYGAVYELVRILDQFRTELPEPGLTYNVGLVLGGATVQQNANKTGGDATGKTNVIPPAALALGDLRTLNDEQTDRVRHKMEAIVRDHLAKTGATIEFEDGYPAMAVTPGSQALLAELQRINATLGYPPEVVTDPIFGGAGDISFVAPYVPGLVGVGAMGAGAHAEGETVYLDSLPRQAKRMAILMYREGRE